MVKKTLLTHRLGTASESFSTEDPGRQPAEEDGRDLLRSLLLKKIDAVDE